jgi:hypothetical protein
MSELAILHFNHRHRSPYSAIILAIFAGGLMRVSFCSKTIAG